MKMDYASMTYWNGGYKRGESQSSHIPKFNVQHTFDTPIYHTLYGLQCKYLAE
jgi:hypothetical protein